MNEGVRCAWHGMPPPSCHHIIPYLAIPSDAHTSSPSSTSPTPSSHTLSKHKRFNFPAMLIRGGLVQYTCHTNDDVIAQSTPPSPLPSPPHLLILQPVECE